MKKTITCLTHEIVKMLEDIYETLEKLLGDKDYIAKQGITIADFSVITTLTSLNVRTSLIFFVVFLTQTDADSSKSVKFRAYP